MSSRHLQDFPQRYLQDVFKAYHQVNLFYLTRPREVFNTFLSTEEFVWVTLFLRNLWSVYKICEKDIKLLSFSFSLYYNFSWLLTEAYLESRPTYTMAFFCGNRFFKNGVMRNLAELTRKHLCRNPFFR